MQLLISSLRSILESRTMNKETVKLVVKYDHYDWEMLFKSEPMNYEDRYHFLRVLDSEEVDCDEWLRFV